MARTSLRTRRLDATKADVTAAAIRLGKRPASAAAAAKHAAETASGVDIDMEHMAIAKPVVLTFDGDEVVGADRASCDVVAADITAARDAVMVAQREEALEAAALAVAIAPGAPGADAYTQRGRAREF